LGIAPISLHAGGVPHIFLKLLTRATTLFKISPQSEVYTQSYGFSKLQESQFWEFQDSNLGISKQNYIWVLAPWAGTKNIIREGGGFPKSKSWWILWVCVCPWFVRAPKVFQLHTNQPIVWFVQVRVSNWPTCQSS
jgi:hypothetical protein